MNGRYRIICYAAVLILVPMFVGLMPLNFIHKAGHGLCMSPVKGTTIKCASCLRHSVSSQPDLHYMGSGGTAIHSGHELPPISATRTVEVLPHNPFQEQAPLRC